MLIDHLQWWPGEEAEQKNLNKIQLKETLHCFVWEYQSILIIISIYLFIFNYIPYSSAGICVF